MKKRIVIVGGGLSGLTLAYLFSKKNIETKVLEASNRLGGRIQTIKGALDTPLELGATWFSDAHQNVLSLLDELDIKKFAQFTKGVSIYQTDVSVPPQQFIVPESEMPSYRVEGGTQNIIDTLVSYLNQENIQLNTYVTSIKEKGDELEIETSSGQVVQADKVIICLPPQLVGSKIKFTPHLPDSLNKLFPTVQTWMAGSIKFVLEYDRPFWREKELSGLLYSNNGIISEMYDHTDFEENKYGFTGFLNAGAASYSQEKRKGFVLNQLSTLLGDEVLKLSSYHDKIWNDKYLISENHIMNSPHQNNGHPLLQESYMNGKLFFSGTETSNRFGGYMEGAILSAIRVVDQIKI
ncbi:FAD-dependent oxidoreductase [Flammeovirga sp. MY04]|uniref:flavin monoamine oxidase family protein n=1 Tax=Flammeovirga sp. MY04 TaxID=1191459 RepID=UPI0008063375|nr:NAD(P)/FAD-dependent oxidoreductase [Flammeovirga sp. MY04]ANQ48569.1 FAD-dependent oxidoreductase [Flammeovirga sp. MY04]